PHSTVSRRPSSTAPPPRVAVTSFSMNSNDDMFAPCPSFCSLQHMQECSPHQGSRASTINPYNCTLTRRSTSRASSKASSPTLAPTSRQQLVLPGQYPLHLEGCMEGAKLDYAAIAASLQAAAM